MIVLKQHLFSFIDRSIILCVVWGALCPFRFCRGVRDSKAHFGSVAHIPFYATASNARCASVICTPAHPSCARILSILSQANGNDRQIGEHLACHTSSVAVCVYTLLHAEWHVPMLFTNLVFSSLRLGSVPRPTKSIMCMPALSGSCILLAFDFRQSTCCNSLSVQQGKHPGCNCLFIRAVRMTIMSGILEEMASVFSEMRPSSRKGKSPRLTN